MKTSLNLLRALLTLFIASSMVPGPYYYSAHASGPTVNKHKGNAAPTDQPGAADDTSLVELDVGGEKGNDGKHGSDYSGHTSSGKGTDGGDATRAQPGTNAGEIKVKLSNFSDGQKKEGVVLLDGYVVDSKNAKGQVSQKIVISDKGYVYLKAHGGAAGHGGNAGGGARGGDGSDGRDATRYSNGTNGDDGYDGGDAGNPTDGETGGKGGKITVEVHEDETELLMLVKEDVEGGDAGKAGKTASGGSGGSGGRGGSSYSWTEDHYSSESDGNGGTRQVNNPTHHTNSGGSSGSSGRSGRSSSYTAKDGKKGDVGQFNIEVKNKDGSVQKYNRRYDMELVDYKIDSDNHDGIFEPGEKASVKQLRVRNNGDMPTPKNQEVEIYLKNNDWVISDADHLVVPKVLQPGEEYIFTDADLNFKVKDTDLVGMGERLVKTDQIRPLSFVTGVNRHFDNFDNVKQFQITYPIEVTPIESLQSLAPGESSRIMYQIKNVSGKDYGSASELKRQIAFDFKLEGGDIDHAQIQMVDAKGKVIDMKDGLYDQIAHLKAGDALTVEGTIGIRPEVAPYSKATVATTLHIGNIDQPDALRTIQKNNITLTAAKIYKKTEGAGMLLVTNHNTTKEEIAAWEKLAKDMDKKLDIWDLSYEGHLDLGKALKTGSTIADDFKNKTIVLLNNPFNDAKGTVKPLNYLTQENFVHAAADRGIKIYSVGDGAGDRFGDLFMPTGAKGTAKASTKELLKDVMAEAKSGSPLAEGALKNFEFANYNRWTLFGKAKKERLVNEANRIQSTLSKLFPDRRYVVVNNFEPKLAEKKLWGAFKKWDYGHLEVRRTLDVADRSFVALGATDAALHTEKFVLSKENRMGLLMAQSFEDKLNLLNTVSDKATASVLSDAISLDLAQEQMLLRSRNWSTRSAGSLKEAMPKLKKFSEFAFDASKTENKAIIEDILLKQRSLNRSQWKWWEKILPFRNNPKVSSASNDLLNKVSKNTFADEHGAVSKKINAEVKDWMKTKEAQKDPVKWAMYPESRSSNLETDYETLKDPKDRQLENEAFAKFDKSAESQKDWSIKAAADNAKRRACIGGVLESI